MEEAQPLLGHEIEQQQQQHQQSYQAITPPDRQIVGFDPNGDTENPLEWEAAYKSGVVFLLALMAFTVTCTCIGVVPLADRIVSDLDGKERKSASIFLVTVWELGEAAGPLLIAPLSEIYGRYPVFVVANALFISGTALAALSKTTTLLIFARFITGFAVASNVLNPAIIGDIYAPESRGSGMSLIMLAPLSGAAVGAAIAGAIAESLGWRMVLWLCAGLATLCEIYFLLFFRETYLVPILQRKAARLRRETGNQSLRCAWEGADAVPRSSWNDLQTAVGRPALVVWSSSVLQIMSLFASICFSLYYILATTLPGILTSVYGFSQAQVGLSFLTFSIGAVGGIIVCNLFLDRIYITLSKTSGGPSPEARLPLTIFGSIFMPLVVILYGWAPSVQWPVWVILTAVGILGFLMILAMVPLNSYVIDSFGLYSASAMTGVLVARCLGGTLLPLTIPPLTTAFGLGYGFLFVAAVILFLIPLPLAVWHFGPRWRQASTYSRSSSL